MTIENDNKAIKRNVDKGYELINARYKLNPIESKLILSIIGLIREEDEDFKTYTIPLNNFSFLTDNKNHSKLKSSCKAIMKKPIEILENDEWEIFNWFSYIKYSKKENAILCRFDKALKPYLINLSGHFKSYKLKNILHLRSEYSIRIYELLKQYEKIGNRKFTINELKDILQLPKSYDSYGQLKRNVLEQAKKELEEHTDIIFEYEVIKPSRKVEGVEFFIFPNDPTDDKADKQKKLMQWIEKIRKDYVNEVLIYHPKKKANIRVSQKGILYLDNGESINSKGALQLWQWLFDNKDKLEINKA